MVSFGLAFSKVGHAGQPQPKTCKYIEKRIRKDGRNHELQVHIFPN